MITETGRIVALESNCLWVETIQASTCESCSARKGCGQSMVAEWSGKTSFIRVLMQGWDDSHFKLHDSVVIGIPERVVANGSLLVYLTPLLMMLLGLGVTEWAQLTEGWTIVSALIGFVMGAGLVRLHSYRHRNDKRVQPVLLEHSGSVIARS